MSADMNRKTLRHFYCRDGLWQSFERMSEDLDRGVDDLVNDAMRAFARDKGYLPTETDGRQVQPAPAAAPQPPARTQMGLPNRAMNPPPPPALGRTTSHFQAIRPAAAPTLPPPPAAPPLESTPVAVAGERQAPPLFAVFQNQKHVVDKEQFIIGRGSRSSDLAIRDGNVSRKHAAVIRRNGAYYMKDLGSTNGIDYNGVRVDNKKIEEGDRFTICDYEIRFTFR